MAQARDRLKDVMPADPLCIPINCPQCRAPGLINLTRLQNGMRCPECDCEFIVARGGHVRRVADLPHVRYSCPRCQQSGLVPAALAARTAKCPQCSLQLARAPDQVLRGVEQATELWRLSGGKAHGAKWHDRITKFFTTGDGRLRKQSIALLSLPAVIVLWLAGLGLMTLFDFSLETRAGDFLLTCLSGNEKEMLKFVEDDAVQHVELKSWSRRLTSILDRHRPAGDRMRVHAQVVEEKPHNRVLLITLRSDFIGTRRHIQHWHERNSTWLFDARATLADEQGAQQKTAAKPSGTKLPGSKNVRPR